MRGGQVAGSYSLAGRGLRGVVREVRRSDPQWLLRCGLGGAWRQGWPLGGCHGSVQGRGQWSSWGECWPVGRGPGSILWKLELLVTGGGQRLTGRQGLIATCLCGHQNHWLHAWQMREEAQMEG